MNKIEYQKQLAILLQNDASQTIAMLDSNRFDEPYVIFNTLKAASLVKASALSKQQTVIYNNLYTCLGKMTSWREEMFNPIAKLVMPWPNTIEEKLSSQKTTDTHKCTQHQQHKIKHLSLPTDLASRP